jgi:hypothetical protein
MAPDTQGVAAPPPDAGAFAFLRLRSVKFAFFWTVVFFLALFVKAYFYTNAAAHDFLKHWTWSFGPHLLDLLDDTVLVAAVGFLVAETAFFKTYVEERVRGTDDFTTRARNSAYLRQFSPAFLKELEVGARRARLPGVIPPAMDTLLENLAAISDGLTVWRTHYRVTVGFKAVAGHPGLRCFQRTTSCRLVNVSDSTQTIKQRIKETSLKIAGFSADVLRRTTLLRVGDKDWLSKVNPTVCEDDTRVSIDLEVEIPVPPLSEEPDGISLMWGVEVVEPLHEPLALTFFRPVHTFQLSLIHPTDLKPVLFLFGVGGEDDTDPLTPCRQFEGYHEWEYGGWFLPDHGVILALKSA